jgi:hypothetical protein
MWVYRTQWQLPSNFTCEHCKLQWVSNGGARPDGGGRARQLRRL